MAEAYPSAADHRPTVLHYVGYHNDHSGIVSVIRSLAGAKEFNSILGVGPGFAAQRANPPPAIEFSGLAAESIGLATALRALRVAFEVRRWLALGADRVVHAHSRAGLLVALWLRHLGERRVVVTVHCYGRQRWFYRWAARRMGGRLFWLTPAMKVYYSAGDRTWEHCIPNSLAGPPVPPRRAARQPGRLVVGGIGALVRWKRWHLVLDALARLPAAQRAQVEFHHIGSAGPQPDAQEYARELHAETRRRGLGAQVRWLGWQLSSDGLLADVDCVVVASKQEPFSMAALEALFAGVPVIAADEGGPTDFIAAGRNGWFFRAGDARDLARVLLALLEPGALGRVDIDRAQLERFTTATVAAQWRRVYDATLRR